MDVQARLISRTICTFYYTHSWAVPSPFFGSFLAFFWPLFHPLFCPFFKPLFNPLFVLCLSPAVAMQRRMLRAISHSLLLYDPDFLLVVDDDTYVNVPQLMHGTNLSRYLTHEMREMPLALGHLTGSNKVCVYLSPLHSPSLSLSPSTSPSHPRPSPAPTKCASIQPPSITL